MELFRKSDYFGNLQLRFNNNEKFHTNLGVILSTIINITCLVFLITSALALLNRDNPIINTAVLRNGEGPNITLNTDDLFLAIRLVDKNHILLDSSIAVLEPKYSVLNNINGYKQRTPTMKQTNCTNYLYLFNQHNLTDDFLRNGIAHATCFNGTDTDKELVIGGMFGSAFYGNLELVYKKCQNSTTSNIICKSTDEINSRLDMGWVQAAYINRYIDVNDYANPIKHYADGFFGIVDPSINKIVYSYVNQVNVASDTGLIFQDTKQELSFKADYTTNDVNIFSAQDTIYTIYVISSKNLEIFYRSYMKIQNLAANIGGFLKALLLKDISLFILLTL